MSFFGGGGRSSAPAAPASQTTFVREAPGIEERKIELMDLARQVAQKPINLPDIQAAGPSALEQLGFKQAATTGVGAGTVQQGIQQIQGAAAPIGAQEIARYLNPYQSYVTDEIARQSQMMQNRLGAQAIGAGAFGGGREGVQQAELQGRALTAMGQAQAQGFNTALGAAQRQQQVGLTAGQQLGALGAGQQQMAQADLQQLMGAGGVQRQLAQQALDAQRATTLQQQYEPYQRAEFLANLYAAGPKTQSGVTMGTQPTTSPLAQAVGTGIGAFAAYTGANQQRRNMSLNKVLNRPMFRHKALKKGDLRPVHAQMGTMVGSPGPTITGVVNPNRLPSTVVKPQGFFQKLGSEFRTSRQGIQQIMNPKSPQFTAKGTFGSGRLLPGLLGVEGVYSVVDPVVGQYMKPGIARDLVSYGISGAATLNPYVRAAGLAKFGYDVADKYAFKPLAAGIKKYRETPVSERKVLPDISGEASLDNFPEPATNEEIKEEVKVTSKAKPGSGRPGFEDRLTEKDNESDVVQGNVDIDKVVKNNDPNKSPVTIGAEDSVAEKGFKEKPKTDTGTKVVTDEKANANVVKAGSNELDKPGKV